MRARNAPLAVVCAAVVSLSACQQESQPGTTGSSENTAPHVGSRSTAGTTTRQSTTRPVASDSPSSVRTLFDRQDMQTSVLRVLADSYGVSGVQEVSCPPGQPVTDGNTFDCTAVIDGERRQVTITVRGSDGEYQVSRPR